MLAQASAANGDSTQITNSTSRNRGVRRPARKHEAEQAYGPSHHREKGH